MIIPTETTRIMLVKKPRRAGAGDPVAHYI